MTCDLIIIRPIRTHQRHYSYEYLASTLLFAMSYNEDLCDYVRFIVHFFKHITSFWNTVEIKFRHKKRLDNVFGNIRKAPPISDSSETPLMMLLASRNHESRQK